MNPTSSVLIAFCSFICDTRAHSAALRDTPSVLLMYVVMSVVHRKMLHAMYVAWHVVAWEEKTSSKNLMSKWSPDISTVRSLIPAGGHEHRQSKKMYFTHKHTNKMIVILSQNKK